MRVSPKRSRSKSAASNSSASRKSRSHSRSSLSKSRSRSRSRSRSHEIDGYRLHIADIADEIRRSDLEKVFSQYGALKEVWMTNSTPCFGFAVYKDKKAAASALKATDGTEISGCRIRVTYARPRTRGSGRRFYNTNMRCYQCGYSGHFYRDCPEVNGAGGGPPAGDKRDRYGRSRGYRDRERDYDREHRKSYRSSRSSRYDDAAARPRRSSGGGSRRHRY